MLGAEIVTRCLDSHFFPLECGDFQNFGSKDLLQACNFARSIQKFEIAANRK
jgi:hypothetical protein